MSKSFLRLVFGAPVRTDLITLTGGVDSFNFRGGFLVACYATLHPALSVRPSVGPSVGPSVRHTLLFLGFWDFWLHCSCPNDLVTSIMAPAHPHPTGVAVYPALLIYRQHRRQTSTITQNLKKLVGMSVTRPDKQNDIKRTDSQTEMSI